MNTDRFSTRKDGFDVLDLRAKFRFKSSSSIGFDFAMGRFHGTILGAIQIHHPCSGHIKTWVFIQLPKQYHDGNQLDQIRRAAFVELGIAADETYELDCDNSEGVHMVQATNREGISDRV